ncbi:MAG: diguanylate cyclase/phosphodiesterase with sensor(s) [Proteobacteria bacterium]|nr:diguanylate cyclase/phosphodiesterase with sensor(s) [Pseudomonadota bacterium]
MAMAMDILEDKLSPSTAGETANDVLRRQAVMLYRSFRSAAFGTVLAATFLVFVLWPHFSHTTLLAWLIGMQAIVAGRAIQAHRLKGLLVSAPGRGGLQAWIRHFSYGLLLAGLHWGGTAFLFMSPENVSAAMFLLLVLTGVAASASILHTSLPATAVPFIALVLIPVAVRMYAFEHIGSYASVAVLGFLLLLWAAARRGHRMLWNSIAVGLDNERLQHAIMADKLAAEGALRAAAQEYQEVFAHITDGLILIDVRDDASFRVAGANAAMAQIVGVPVESAIGKTFGELVEPELASQAEANYRRCVDLGDPIHYESEFCRSGVVRHFDSMLVPMSDGAGRVFRVIGIHRDITERKQLEVALAAREREFRTLVENSPEVIIRYDRDLRRVFSNPAFDQLLGVLPGETRGKEVSSCWAPRNISVDEFEAILRRVFASCRPEECLLEFRDKRGSLVCLNYRLVPEFGLDGRVESVLGFGHNVSALKRQEALGRAKVHILERLGQGAELSEVLELVTALLEQESPGYLCSIMLLDEAGERLHIAAAASLPEKYCRAIEGVRIGDGIGSCGTAAWSGKEVFVENIATHPYWASYRDLPLKCGLRACWSFPIADSGGKVLGVFGIYRREPGLPSEAELESIRQAHHLAMVAIERNRIEAKLKYQASFDALTGLPNRSLFYIRLRDEMLRAARTGHGGALLFIDLDRFKEVNDSLGHESGDSLLVEAAERIRAQVRASDLVARLGGDEFVVVLPDVRAPEHLGLLAQAIVDALVVPFVLDGHQAYVSASVGIACYPQDAEDADILLCCADKAMYVAKELGRNGFCFFTESMQTSADYRLKLSHDLRSALADGQLLLHYQPIVEVESGRVVKAEALLRWRHPQRGMVPPDQFIHLAEETGLIHAIGDWVFQQAALTARDWAARMPAGAADCQISVNMSPRQFVKDGSEAGWLDYLKSIGLDPRHIGLEITEGLLLDERLHVAERLAAFRASGIQISLDDFGTGYSAMAYLKKYPIDYLKIDRTFVRDLVSDSGDRAIAQAMIFMASQLGLKTVAEGVETAEQRDLLQSFGCDLIQGYYYARPLPRDEFMAYLEQANVLSPSSGLAQHSRAPG